MRVFYRENRFFCGAFMDVEIYPVFKKPGKRKKQCKPSSEIQKRLNQRRRELKLTRLIHTNFTNQDIALHLTYDDENLPKDDTQAKRDVQNFLRRVNYFRRKNGLVGLKYISVTEKGKKTGRYHHHILMQGDIDRDVLEGFWKKGIANADRLKFGKNGLVGLSKYMVKAPVFDKHYNCSRNLAQPVVKTRDNAITGTKARELCECAEYAQPFEALYPGYTFAEAEPLLNQVNGGYYLLVRMRREAAMQRGETTQNKNAKIGVWMAQT